MRYFTNLEFYSDEVVFGPSLQRKRALWTLAVYLILCAGILARQVTTLVPLNFDPTKFSWGVFAASIIVGLAILPPVMRWISGKKRVPSWEHVLSAFGIGFFIDFSSAKILGAIWSGLMRH
jgi:hypothetical protein